MDKFVIFLQDTLNKRSERNPMYSLRSFAKDLEIDPPSLSKILNGKKLAGVRLKNRLATNLNLSPKQIASIIKTESLVEQNIEATDYSLIEEDKFQYLSSWKYYAVLELLELKDFKSDVQWMAKRLSLSNQEIRSILDRLERLNLIKKDEENNWIDISGGVSTSMKCKNSSSVVRRAHQVSLLEKSINSVKTVPINKRDHSSMTLAIDTEDMDEVKELITEFRRKLGRYLSKKEKKDQVYNLSISFFPLTELERE